MQDLTVRLSNYLMVQLFDFIRVSGEKRTGCFDQIVGSRAGSTGIGADENERRLAGI